jgi:hypothetical protein
MLLLLFRIVVESRVLLTKESEDDAEVLLLWP